MKASHLIPFALAITALVACNTSTTPSVPTPTETPEQSQPPPSITSAALEGLLSGKQVRQGHGTVLIKVEGEHLSGITAATLQPQEAAEGAVGKAMAAANELPLTVLNNTDTMATLQASIPHGAKLGVFGLKLMTSKSGSFAEVLEVTNIHASPGGSDVLGLGTAKQPYRSLSKAVSVADNADGIVLAEGDYSAASGEVFPINISGRSIRGAATEKSIIKGSAAEACLVVSEPKGDTRLTDLVVKSCKEGISLEHDRAVLTRVKAQSNQVSGLYLKGTAEAVIQNSAFVQNTVYGISATASSKVSFEGDQVTDLLKNESYGLYQITNAKSSGKNLNIVGNGVGIYVVGSGTSVVLTKTLIAENENSGIQANNNQEVVLSDSKVVENKQSGIRVLGNAKLNLNGVEVAENAADGVYVNVSETETAELDLYNAKIRKNGQSGVEFRSANAASKLSMVKSTVAENTTYGLYLAGVATGIHLGQLKPSDNFFHDNGTTGLTDARAANTGTIMAVGTKFATAGIVTPVIGLRNGPSSGVPHWQIINLGNSINFGAP